jgi:hypothetical protein
VLAIHLGNLHIFLCDYSNADETAILGLRRMRESVSVLLEQTGEWDWIGHFP